MSYEYCYYTETMCLSLCMKKYCKYNKSYGLYCCTNSSNNWMYWVFGAIGVLAVIALLLVVWGLCETRKQKRQKIAVETEKLITQQSLEPQVQYSVLANNTQITVINPPQETL
ncbi:Hypothetical_protein [Hexamita inflata]|uniref:Hypothetical_protein n=1 Tax=Hexamita inflata TaxID=28002 RepID=A0AA86QGN8_9EUKA|nr:Hypothetical protein HINF_LOCUS46566 [Hexamita inflata]